MFRIITFSFLLSLFLLPAAFSQEINPDRPDQTESPDILNKNNFQIESGLFYEKDNSESGAKIENFNLPEILMRYGLSRIIEIRLSVNYVREDV